MKLNYNETVTLYKTVSGNYANNKTVSVEAKIPCIWLQNTSYTHVGNQSIVESGTAFFPDPEDDFVINNHNRLEGMFVLAPIFGDDNDEAWYRIESVEVNRDHLLKNEINNIQCFLNKTSNLVIEDES
jgi:hypothetical protein